VCPTTPQPKPCRVQVFTSVQSDATCFRNGERLHFTFSHRLATGACGCTAGAHHTVVSKTAIINTHCGIPDCRGSYGVEQVVWRGFRKTMHHNRGPIQRPRQLANVRQILQLLPRKGSGMTQQSLHRASLSESTAHAPTEVWVARGSPTCILRWYALGSALTHRRKTRKTKRGPSTLPWSHSYPVVSPSP